MEEWDTEIIKPHSDWHIWDSKKSNTNSLEIKSRRFWQAQPEKWSWPLELPITSVFVCSTLSDPCFSKHKCVQEAQYIQNYYMRNGTCPDIRYSFLIGGDGTVYEGRGWNKRPGLPPNYHRFNPCSIFIGLIGNFYDKPPKDTMFQSRDDLIKYGIEHEYIAERFLLFHTRPAGKTYSAG